MIAKFHLTSRREEKGKNTQQYITASSAPFKSAPGFKVLISPTELSGRTPVLRSVGGGKRPEPGCRGFSRGSKGRKVEHRDTALGAPGRAHRGLCVGGARRPLGQSCQTGSRRESVPPRLFPLPRSPPTRRGSFRPPRRSDRCAPPPRRTAANPPSVPSPGSPKPLSAERPRVDSTPVRTRRRNASRVEIGGKAGPVRLRCGAPAWEAEPSTRGLRGFFGS